MKFESIADNLNYHLDKLVEKINNSNYVLKKDIKNINGIYVFYENDKPIYVGRTNKNRMRERIYEHSRKSSNINSATFAYLIFQDIYKKTLTKDDTYVEEFLKCKERVAKMSIKIVEIDDEIIQTIFEPYLAYKLDTIKKFNKFHTS